MRAKGPGNVRILGAGEISGGIRAVRLRVWGAGEVDGDVEAERIRVLGACEFRGEVASRDMRTCGACEVYGGVRARFLRATGAFEAGRVEAEAVRAYGAAEVGGDLVAKDDVRLRGVLEVAGDVQATRFSARGSVAVQGLLSADAVLIRLHRPSHVGTIGGSRIAVRRMSWHRRAIAALLRRRGEPMRLVAEAIEGDEVDLEATAANVVRGKKVRIGPGCRIARVEYQETLAVHPEAVVDAQVKA
ncbi:hypothetical protein H5T53_05645 [Candidatus Bipolaricaulota bacterium]|nr:hypothetical protein [Candidatus Bipolaricaulota bacterium]